MSSIKRLLIAGLVVLSIASCAMLSSSKQPVVSENDQRSYLALTLPNQLEVLLISDPKAEKASASLDLHIGSRQDPIDTQGLAHFLEHMLFLGTEKYPEPGEYQAFMNEHGGAHNAYTAFEHTNYFFDVEPQSLEPALDRFSQFFIAPLFTQQYVEREKNAVHSEYMSKIKDDARKSLDVFKQQINPKHPFSKFSVGSLSTLSSASEGELRQALLDFYQQYYTANLMKLVVVGNQPLEELRALVEPRFSPIVNKQLPLEAIKEPLFTEQSLPMQIMIKPEKKQRELSFNFPVEDVYGYYHEKPLVYLGGILGHEGEGSLLSYLKRQGWAEALGAGAGLSFRGGANFSVSISLTEQGYAHYPEVVNAFFQTIKTLKQAGPQAWLYQEQASLANQHFRYQESVEPIQYSRQLANDMHYYAVEDVLQGSYMMDKFDEGLINQFLAALRPDNMLLTLTAPEVMTDKHSNYYQTPYSVNKLNAQQVAAWEQLADNDEIYLPKANAFIASDFGLIAAAKAVQVPELMIDQPNVRWWFKNDEDFNIPKGFVALNLRSSLAGQTARQAVLLKLYEKMLQEQVNEYAYPATLAGLYYSLNSHMRGLTLKVSGFNDTQTLLFNKLIDAVASTEFDELRFTRVKADIQRNLENAAKQQPYIMLMGDLNQLMYKQLFSEAAMLAELNTVSMNDLKVYVSDFLQQLNIDALVYGNYSKQQASGLAAIVQAKLLTKNAVARVEIPGLEVRRLTSDDQMMVVNNGYSDAALVYYVQAGDDSHSTRAAFEVTAQILKPDFYTQLRTEKQLGYIVASGAYPMHKVPGLFFVVQSPVMGVHGLQTEFLDFLQQKKLALAELDEASFMQAKQVLIQRYAEKPTNLGESQERYWQDIALQYYDFDFRSQQISALESLSLTQWQQLVAEQLFAEASRGLWLYSVGAHSDGSPLVGSHIKSLEVIDTQQEYYSF